MYEKSFYISSAVGNNELSFNKRKNKSLYVPSLIKGTFRDIELGNEVVFEDYDFDGNLISAKGLKNFYHLTWKGIDLYLFDNHNHALFFWYKAYFEGKVNYSSYLIHIDEHSDMREPNNMNISNYFNDLDGIFDYTNFVSNVGNYILPAKKEGLIKEIYQIRSDSNIDEFIKNQPYIYREKNNNDFIVNLDLDFFEPNLDYIDYNKKISLIREVCIKAGVITVATSPFFIDQNLALKVFKDIFKKK